MRILFLFFVVLFPQTGYGQTIWDTSGHPKANGLEIKMKIPAGYEAKEGEKPHIVQKFVNTTTDSRITRMCMLFIKDMGRELSKKDAIEVFDDYQSILKEIGTPIGKATKTTVETLPGAIGDIYILMNRAGLDMVMIMRSMSTIYKRNYISFQCSVGTAKNSPYRINEEFIKATPEFFTFFNGVTIRNVYR